MNPARFAQYARNVWGVEEPDDALAAEQGIAATEGYFRSLGMPVRLSQLSGVGVQDEAGIEDLALRCSYQKTRTVGTFRTLGYDDMLQIYRAANEKGD